MKSKIKLYLEYAFRETKTFQVYLSAAVIGIVICFFTSNYSVIPFIVPLCVQILVKSNATKMRYGGQEQKILVWFQDISLRKIYHLRLQGLLRYSASLIESLDKPIKQDSESEHLSFFLLKEYEAVFISRKNFKKIIFKPDHIR